MPAAPDPFLIAIEPFRENVVVGVECLFTWYWLADLCAEHEIPFILGHALYMKAIHGGKAKNDHKLEHLIVQQIRVIGQDKKLQAETMKQVRRAARERRASLTAEEKTLRSSSEKVQAETNGLLKALADGTTNGPAISGRLSDLEEQAARLKQRLAEIERERQAADQSNLDPNDLASALSLFDPIWEVLFPAEQARIIELLISQIEYNGKSGKLAVTFHPTGIKSLAGEVNQEATA